MKTKKHVKPLKEATVYDLTDETCGFCGLNLMFVEADTKDGLAWLSCPTYIGEREFSQDEHSSYSVPLADTAYKPGDELKEHQHLKEPKDEGHLHHDRPNMTNPQNENRKKFTNKTR